ncbi:glycerophosphodiester phosphodiesterase family protein [Enterovirga sp.]|uniref:glycerophosphodiester phosphodiesterase family protein n=1 Tax=Enterovirga sp. TaxID=2026350 RepID=UPI002615BAD9|nr:glycerophosphodiester phosphodiesterase family protein [Enterovirga sp.]MDB5591563.1 glycerophosphodiester phosphodiesterase [Enterovirga sp.]
MTAPSWLVARPIAHRGLHSLDRAIPENTAAAAEAAVAGRFAIECDVQLSADGDAMVFHDHELDRLTDRMGPVLSLPAAALSTLSVGGTAERIPSLAAWLDRIAGRTPVVIEIKSRFDGDERLARRVAEVLRGRTEPLAVKSFDPELVQLLRRIAPHVPRGIVAMSRYVGAEWARLTGPRKRDMANLLHWGDTRPDFISWHHADLPNAATALPRLLAGVPVMTWTIRSPAEEAAVRPHADQIVFEGFVPA